ncbi:uncharacterized protein LOC127247711 [Andrographis paniculata]|uniref:uncharacterized protein LOC127247711 n=1 Tax=Andrographis paniculata TaxID=175694 RepID=UPI0021E82547|nr:uncharacterized protein LOC127247711 [Andrographis paniculata]XP_051125640.1 uncharacterized protein LOC127247711 [Andrographis paniculata]
MTTVEKLLVQIFERKNSIIEQVRQQTELYGHHCASKLLIDGITPPPWLWDAESPSNSKELNKEELISKLLNPRQRPQPQPQPHSSARCSLVNYYPFRNSLVTIGDYEAFSEQVPMESMAFNKEYNRKDGTMVPECSGEDHAGCAIDSVPEPDTSVTSPEVKINKRPNEAEQSLSRIQRSRCRQKALQLRNSAKSKAKSCSSSENIGQSLSNQINFSLSTNLRAQKDEVAKLAETHAVASQSCKSLEMTKGIETTLSPHQPEKLGAAKVDSGVESLRLDNADQSVIGVSSSDVRSVVSEAREPISEDVESHGGRPTIPFSSSSQLNCVEDASHSYNYSNEPLGLFKPSIGFSHRMTRSQTHSSGQEKPEPSDYNDSHCSGRLMSKSNRKRKSADDGLQIVQGFPLCETHDTLDKNEMARISIPSNVNERNQLESDTVLAPLGSFEALDSLLLKVIENENPNLEASASSSRKRRLGTQADKSGSSAAVSDYTAVRTSEDNLESDTSYLSSEAHQEAYIMPSPLVDIPTSQLDHELESFHQQQKEEGNPAGEGMDNGRLLSYTPESEKLGSSVHQNCPTEPRVDSCSKQIGKLGDGVCEKHVGYIPGRESWPQLKRRKNDHLKAQSSTASQSPVARMGVSILRSPSSRGLENLKMNFDTLQNMDCTLTKGIETTLSSHQPESAVELIPSLTKEEARNSHGCFVESTSTLHSSSNDGGETGGGQYSHEERNSNHPSSKTLTLASSMVDELQSQKWDSDPQAQSSILSQSFDDLNLLDQSMAVFERFTADAEADNELKFEANGVNFGQIELPRNAIERASILAEMCKSASLNTPMSHFSSSFELQGAQSLFQSVSDDQYKHLNMQSTSPLSFDIENQLQSGSVLADDYNDPLSEIPYCDLRGYSGVHYDWKSKNLHGSPVGKPWGDLEPSSHGGSLGKSSCSNPELVCFTIEEDPCTGEENKCADEHADDVQEKSDPSSASCYDRRQPLKDLTNLNLNPDLLVTAQDDILRTKDGDIASNKLSATGAQEEVQLSTNNHSRDGSQTMEKKMPYVGSTNNGRISHTSSNGANSIRKTKESISNSTRKPTLLNKASLKGLDQKNSLKESKRNNIVSNVDSFIPLVQQKKAAVTCTGKRDVKVKALEAAEAAKRLAEKRENERKMKKEALKIERAKMEERNLRNMELEKKKKEEERKKRDADNMAKKRHREEEAKKEKEKKRIKLETRQRQREQGGKEKLQSKDDLRNTKKELLNESKKPTNVETSKGDATAFEKTQTKWTSDELNYEDCGTSSQSCEPEKAKHTVDMTPTRKDLIIQDCQEQSYEISPYQCSDDEDEDEEEEEDKLRAAKFIPSWASTKSVALLLAQQKDVDPDLVFLPESFCSIDEVLLPRKQQEKEMATRV